MTTSPDISFYLIAQSIVIGLFGILMVVVFRKTFPPVPNLDKTTQEAAQVDALVKTSGDLQAKLIKIENEKATLQLNLQRMGFENESLKTARDLAVQHAEDFRQKFEIERARYLALLYQCKSNGAKSNNRDAVQKTILVVSASPDDADRLRVDQEARAIEESLGALFSVRIVMAARARDLVQALTRHKPRFIHFSGHGINGDIVLEDESGKAQAVSLSGLSSIICPFMPEGIVLNACHSADGLEKVIECAEWVIAMSEKISDKGAIAFSTGFYLAMESGDTIEDAFAAGRGMLGMISNKEINIPVLKKNKH